jgi:hypothetical protein
MNHINKYVISIRERVYTLNEILSLFNDVFSVGTRHVRDLDFNRDLNRYIIFWEHYFDDFIYRMCNHEGYTGYDEEVKKLNEVINPKPYQVLRSYSFYEVVSLLRDVYEMGATVYKGKEEQMENMPMDEFKTLFYGKIKSLNLSDKLDSIKPYHIDLEVSEEYVEHWNLKNFTIKLAH